MENFKLNSSHRPGRGKGAARKLRAVGQIPGVLYGHKEDVIGFSVDEAELRTILVAHPDSAIVDIDIETGKKRATVNAIVRDVQRHPATGRVLHVDFQRISLDEKVRMEVHVQLIGNPIGVKEQGGILEHGTRALSILCLPTQIPDAIEVDVSGLNIHDHARLAAFVGDYPDVEFLDDPDTWLATVIPPAVEATTEVDEAIEGEEAPAAETTEDAAPAEEESS